MTFPVLDYSTRANFFGRPRTRTRVYTATLLIGIIFFTGTGLLSSYYPMAITRSSNAWSAKLTVAGHRYNWYCTPSLCDFKTEQKIMVTQSTNTFWQTQIQPGCGPVEVVRFFWYEPGPRMRNQNSVSNPPMPKGECDRGCRRFLGFEYYPAFKAPHIANGQLLYRLGIPTWFPCLVFAMLLLQQLVRLKRCGENKEVGNMRLFSPHGNAIRSSYTTGC